MKKNKIVIFDFCNTLVNFQSADAFVNYVKARSPQTARRTLIEGFRIFLLKTKLMHILQRFDPYSYLNKRLLLAQLKGLSKKELEKLGESFFKEIISLRYIPETIQELLKCQKNGCRICIASGGYDTYLSYVKNHFKIDYLVCTSLKYKHDIFTGHFSGKDCIRNQKLPMVIKQLGEPLLANSETIFYSDSITDLPLFKYCDKGIVVCTTPPAWARKNKLEVLICQK